jgi:hypothetical protein
MGGGGQAGLPGEGHLVMSSEGGGSRDATGWAARKLWGGNCLLCCGSLRRFRASVLR